MLADKPYEDENVEFKNKLEKKIEKKIEAVQKDEYMLYDDEEVEEVKEQEPKSDNYKHDVTCNINKIENIF